MFFLCILQTISGRASWQALASVYCRGGMADGKNGLSGGKKGGCMRKEAILLGEIGSKEMSTVILFICTLSSIERRGNNKLIKTLLAY